MSSLGDQKFKGQLQLGIERSPERDRNHHLGGRSFYFFDFDDNIAFLNTEILIFHKRTGEEVALSSGEWAKHHHEIGKTGLYKDFEIRLDDRSGSFRNFRDQEAHELERLGRQRQIFVEDVALAIGQLDVQWKGPSWECFYHAAFNQRPISVITARGHAPNTLKEGIRVFIKGRHLPIEPNYLSIFPVSHPETRLLLGDQEMSISVAELKQRAIRASVEQALVTYGYSPHHRFGMSDDDPRNIQLIVEELSRLKSKYPEMNFFMIETHGGNFIKHEIGLSGLESHRIERVHQLSLFDQSRSE